MNRISFILLGVACLVSCATKPSSDSKPVGFSQHIKPVFEHRCVRCHSDKMPGGGMNLQNRASVLSSPRKFIVPGQPESSLIYQALTRPAMHPTTMPGDGWGISEGHLSLFRQWIADGADWPVGEKIVEKEMQVELDDYL